jgi:hypothetical protein
MTEDDLRRIEDLERKARDQWADNLTLNVQESEDPILNEK